MLREHLPDDVDQDEQHEHERRPLEEMEHAVRQGDHRKALDTPLRLQDHRVDGLLTALRRLVYVAKGYLLRFLLRFVHAVERGLLCGMGLVLGAVVQLLDPINQIAHLIERLVHLLHGLIDLGPLGIHALLELLHGTGEPSVIAEVIGLLLVLANQLAACGTHLTRLLAEVPDSADVRLDALVIAFHILPLP